MITVPPLNWTLQTQCEFYIHVDLNIAYIICCPLSAINQVLAGFVLLRNFPGCLQELIHLETLSSAMDWLTFSRHTVVCVHV